MFCNRIRCDASVRRWDGGGRQPQAVYSVRFTGRELWGDSAESNQVLYIDLWESYLEADQLPPG